MSRRAVGDSPALAASIMALVMASAGTGYAALGEAASGGPVAAGNARGEPVQIQLRNRSRGETGLVTASDGYALRLSNTRDGGGGGAVYGCRAPDAPPAQDLACLYADNLRGGKAFLFRSQEGPTVGHFDLGNPAGPPFTTNATGLVANLNADKVDGLDASQLQGAQGPAGSQGAQGPQGDVGPTIGAWDGGFCNPAGAAYVDCAGKLVTFPAAGNAMLVGTASWEGVDAPPTSGNCRLRVDDVTSVGFSTSFGESTATFTGGLFPGKLGTVALTGVTEELPAGPHQFDLECSEGDANVSISNAQLSIVVLGGS